MTEKISNIPSDDLKAKVLDTVYEKEGIQPVHGYSYLAAIHRRTRVGIVVVDGAFNREVFRQANQEAQSAGASTSRMYVYGRTCLYSGRCISFSKFEEIGL